MSDHPENRPTVYGFVDGGRVHGLAGTEFDGDPVPVSGWLPDLVRAEGAVVIKPLRGTGGEGVLMCEYDGEFLLDGDPIPERTLCETVEGLSRYLVTEFVEQHAYADELYPDATNTVRAITFWDDREGEVYVPAAVHRIGTGQSKPVDNWSRGGLSAQIDLDTGELGRAARFDPDTGVRWYSSHPDTGSRIEGTTVPDWDAVLDTIEEVAADNTNVPYLGWDVVLSATGTPIVLEANSCTGVESLQVHEPLLADPRLERILREHL